MSQSTTSIAFQILGYLADHPEAEDTLDGVSIWWLPQGCRIGLLEEAVEYLARQDLLVSHTRGSETMYGLNREKVFDIRRILREAAIEEKK